MDLQLRDIRHRQIAEALHSGQKRGSYWSILVSVKGCGQPARLPVDLPRALELASIPARYAKLEPEIQARLVNWGYAVCDAAMDKQLGETHPVPAFPYPVGV
jgi:NTE family protein